MKEFSCYLFDADGTLFDTTELICQCFLNTAKYAKKPGLKRTEILRYIGMTLRDQMNIHFGPLSDQHFSELRSIHMEYQLSIYKDYLKLFDGVLETLQFLKEQGKRCAVVTSRFRASLDTYLTDTGIISYFDHFITPEVTSKHKPDAEPAVKALELLNVSAEDAILIGDSTFDIECGAAAGTKTAFVLWSLNNISSLRVAPTYFLEKMTDLCCWKGITI
ncbi:MAG: HAD-IA family hydrolase [Methanomicrobiales archaeon]|nr:HAD-IA family hydrolase [Methanomicrobiales archaeon]